MLQKQCLPHANYLLLSAVPTVRFTSFFKCLKHNNSPIRGLYLTLRQEVKTLELLVIVAENWTDFSKESILTYDFRGKRSRLFGQCNYSFSALRTHV